MPVFEQAKKDQEEVHKVMDEIYAVDTKLKSEVANLIKEREELR